MLKDKYEKSPSGLLYIAPTGYGKTLEVLKFIRNSKTSVVSPASLQSNFNSQEKKFFNNVTPRFTTTYAKISRGLNLPGGNNLVIDESHNIKNPKTKTYHNLASQRSKYKKALLMTATPAYNEAYDVAPQINMVAGKRVLPFDKKLFYKKYFKEEKVSPGFINSLLGVKPGVKRVLKDPKLVQRDISKYVYKVNNGSVKKLLPQKSEEVVEVTMSPNIRRKVRQNILPSKTESKHLNTFLSAIRQVSNTTRPFVKDKSKSSSSKFDKMISDAAKEVKSGGKVLMYSNFREAGVGSLSTRLKKLNIKHGMITGSMPKNQRTSAVKDYLSNKYNVMLYSGAGAEGINLPKTTLVEIAEPYWNSARIQQAEARGIRRGDNPNRTVKIRKYVSVFPKKKPFLGIFPRKRNTSVDQYMRTISKKKKEEALQFLGALSNQ